MDYFKYIFVCDFKNGIFLSDEYVFCNVLIIEYLNIDAIFNLSI